MSKLFTKHIQYTGTDDYDIAIDTQINEFLQQEDIDDVIDIKFEGHSALGVNTYSALIIYRKKE